MRSRGCQYARFLGGLIAVLLGPVNAQTAEAERDRPLQHVFREIRDPHTGLTWVVEADPKHAGGPGRMTLAADDLPEASAGVRAKRIVIHAGEKVILEDHKRLLDASFEAVALHPAMAGSRLYVRLKSTGKVMSAIAIAPGKACLLPSMEARP